jgi:hypothetical protein
MNELTVSYEELIAEVKKEMSVIGFYDFPMYDLFTPGMYVRTVHIPEGSYVISEKHKTIHPFMLSKGSITIFTENGGMETYDAPYLGVTFPGIRFARSNSDVIWTTFHVTKVMPKDNSEKEIVKARKKVEKKVVEKDKHLIK